MTELDSWLATALGLADDADGMALAARPSDLDVRAKPDGSFVTHVDQAIERLIRERISDAFPEHAIVGEEFGLSGSGAAVRWFIDPIDGTHNFMRGVPLYGTLMAVEWDGELQVGVVSAPGAGASMVGATGRAAPGHANRSGRHAATGPCVGHRHAWASRSCSTDPSWTCAGRGSPERSSDAPARSGGSVAIGDFWGYMLVARAPPRR